MVRKGKFIGAEDFQKDVVVANITPGALTSKVVTGAGMQFGSRINMVLLPVFMAAPAAVLSVLLLMLKTGLNEKVLIGIEFISILVTSLVAVHLLKYVEKPHVIFQT